MAYTSLINALTTKGQALNAKIQLGGGDIPLHITRIVTGAGTSADPLNQDDVVDMRQTFSIQNREVVGLNAKIWAVLTNWGNPQHPQANLSKFVS